MEEKVLSDAIAKMPTKVKTFFNLFDISGLLCLKLSCGRVFEELWRKLSKSFLFFEKLYLMYLYIIRASCFTFISNAQYPINLSY